MLQMNLLAHLMVEILLISNLTINLPTDSNLGLFGVNGGTIANVTLENADYYSGNENVGGVVGSNNGGTIENVSVENVAITGTI